MEILIRDVKGNQLELSHGSAVCVKGTRSEKEVHFEWPDLPKMFQQEVDDLASRAVRIMEQARELITVNPDHC